MFLAIDCGNTSVEFGFFEDHELCHIYRAKTTTKKTSDAYAIDLSSFLTNKNIQKESVQAILISSVVPSFNETLREVCQSVFGLEPFLIGPGFPSGVRINTDNPKEVGGDLIADCAGAKALFGGPAIICDLGTATKIILMGPDGSFEGCTIAPGLAISLSALVGKAALLGEVDIRIPEKKLGKNTADCISSSLTYGTSYAIKGLADEIEKEAGYPCKRIITGGYSKLLLPLLGEFTYASHLALRGIYAIYERKSKQ